MSASPAEIAANYDARIHFLDYLRIFAFASVLVGHEFWNQLNGLAVDGGKHASLRLLAELLLPLTLGGAAGVVVFFLVSGYIITHVLRTESTLDFAVKRIFRIYPLFLFATLLEAAMATAIDGAPWPPASQLLPRLLLLGDFFKVPVGLAGVEWTLRIEIMFYALMAGLKWMGVLDRPRWLPALFLLLSGLLLFAVKPFPHFAGWSDGYVNLYSPFLFIGAIVYVAQARLADRRWSAAAAAAILLMYWLASPAIQPSWAASHFAAYGVGIFLLAWALRGHVRTGLVAVLLSDLTYSVYLFHKWLWPYLDRLVAGLQPSPALRAVLILLLLFAACYAFHRLVEKNGIRAGRALLRRLRAAPGGASLALDRPGRRTSDLGQPIPKDSASENGNF